LWKAEGPLAVSRSRLRVFRLIVGYGDSGIRNETVRAGHGAGKSASGALSVSERGKCHHAQTK